MEKNVRNRFIRAKLIAARFLRKSTCWNGTLTIISICACDIAFRKPRRTVSTTLAGSTTNSLRNVLIAWNYAGVLRVLNLFLPVYRSRESEYKMARSRPKWRLVRLKFPRCTCDEKNLLILTINLIELNNINRQR